nr:glycosyltransferase [Tsuneonella aeria]
MATVGTQLPFPRLLESLDRIAGRSGLHIVAQICQAPGPYPHLEQHAFIEPARFDALLSEASVLIGHAGIGTIFAAARSRIPLILFPRQFALNEHRNDHQMATARAFEDRPGIHVAWTDNDLERLVLTPGLEPMGEDSWTQREPLLATLRAFFASL